MIAFKFALRDEHHEAEVEVIGEGLASDQVAIGAVSDLDEPWVRERPCGVREAGGPRGAVPCTKGSLGEGEEVDVPVDGRRVMDDLGEQGLLGGR